MPCRTFIKGSEWNNTQVRSLIEPTSLYPSDYALQEHSSFFPQNDDSMSMYVNIAWQGRGNYIRVITCIISSLFLYWSTLTEYDHGSTQLNRWRTKRVKKFKFKFCLRLLFTLNSEDNIMLSYPYFSSVAYTNEDFLHHELKASFPEETEGKSEISGSHGGEYKEDCLLGCCAV
jgi:hypothetical protein